MEHPSESPEINCATRTFPDVLWRPREMCVWRPMKCACGHNTDVQQPSQFALGARVINRPQRKWGIFLWKAVPGCHGLADWQLLRSFLVNRVIGQAGDFLHRTPPRALVLREKWRHPRRKRRHFSVRGDDKNRMRICRPANPCWLQGVSAEVYRSLIAWLELDVWTILKRFWVSSDSENDEQDVQNDHGIKNETWNAAYTF